MSSMSLERVTTEKLTELEQCLREEAIVDARYDQLDHLTPGDVGRVLLLQMAARQATVRGAALARAALWEIFDVAKQRAEAASARAAAEAKARVAAEGGVPMTLVKPEAATGSSKA